MAQGSALILGFRLPQNFDGPYFATNISEFWRKWHMSLSRWLRDYLYIPLGGSRGGAVATYRNLLITMTLGGLWHGANWTFVFWGVYQGLLLSLHKFVHERFRLNVPRWLALLITFHAVCVGWVFFRASSLQESLSILGWMVRPDVHASKQDCLVFGAVLAFLGGHYIIRRWFGNWRLHPVFPLAEGLGYFAVLCLAVIVATPPQEFIYFQF